MTVIFRALFSLIVSLPVFLSSFGQVTDTGFARMKAEEIFSAIMSIENVKGNVKLSERIINDNDSLPAIYIYNDSKGRFVFLSAEKRTFPVLGWSDEPAFNEDGSAWPGALKDLVQNWIDQIGFIRANHLKSTPDIDDMWARLENGDITWLNSGKDVVPLLSTKWNQTCGYNAQCPADPAGPCGRALTGCVATAMAQVIRYNEYPVNGTGSKCYTHSKYGELCTDFSAAGYNYSGMSNTSGNAEVAKLMYHCGVAVSMNYGPSSSGAYSSSVANAMRNYLDYTNGLIISKGSYSEEIWTNILVKELESSRPIYYSGSGTSGHAFVLDGFEAASHFHVNWGWGGSYNGYFYLNSLNPGSMNFTSGQQAVAGMVPEHVYTGPDFLNAPELTCRTPVSGSISAGTDNANYYGNTYPATFGKELIFRFATVLPGRIRVKVSEQTGSVYTFLLNSGNKDSLVTYGVDGLVIDNTDPGTYYIAVEGVNGNEPDFVIEVVCPTSEADIDIRSASVLPVFIQSLQHNVALSSTVRNIGNSNAGEFVVEFFLSKDAELGTLEDTHVGEIIIPHLEAGKDTVFNKVVTMPDSLRPGSHSMLFVADRRNMIPETDDENIYAFTVTVPDSGKLICRNAIALEDNKWYYGNTLEDGASNLEKYSMAWDMTGPEVVHTFTPEYNGIVRLTFVEKSPGMLYATVFPVCNENSAETSLRIYTLTDTVTTGEFYAIAGNQYYIVVDGHKNASGDYGIKAGLPGECPDIQVKYWGKLDLCEGDQWPGFSTFWGHSNYQWFRDDFIIPGAVSSAYTPSSPGIYHLEVTENSCKGTSEQFSVRVDSRPDTAIIITTDETVFCDGESASLQLSNEVSYPVIWARNDTLAEEQTGTECIVTEAGKYTLYTINGVCRMPSKNSIDITVLPLPADIAEYLPLPSDKIIFYYTFNRDNNVVGDNKNTMSGWDYEPADDRFGNFWQARYLNGDKQMLYSSYYDTIPGEFTGGLWFMTSTVTGGVITGFYDSPWNPSKMDAIIYMSDNGRVHFWISNGSTPIEISSSLTYNDGQWHYIGFQHSNRMILDLDNGKEKIISGPFAEKQEFKGYWILGGPALPEQVSAMPDSVFFKGAVDDFIMVKEQNEYLPGWMVLRPDLEVITGDPAPVCLPASISYDLPFSQNGTEYRLYDITRSSFAPISAVGNGGPVTIGGSELTTGINEFRISARDIQTGCELLLDTLLVVDISSLCTSLKDAGNGEELKVYPVPADDFVCFESETEIREIIILDLMGRILHKSFPDSKTFTFDAGNLSDNTFLVYLIRTAGMKALSGKIILR